MFKLNACSLEDVIGKFSTVIAQEVTAELSLSAEFKYADS